ATIAVTLSTSWALTRHLPAPGNLAIVARRQMPPAEPCRYFWVTDAITLDGVIRSDNRGGETLFPLFLSCEDEGRQVNLSSDFLARAAELAELSPDESSALRVFYYLYAQFFSTSYRERYAEQLRIDFPRVFLPQSRSLFVAMSDFGAELVALHLGDGGHRKSDLRFCGESRDIAAGFPKYADESVRIKRGSSIGPVSAEAWEWRVGAHQVCRKWLKDRQARMLTEEEIRSYARIVTAATETARLSRAIDGAIAEQGGWPDAFLS
ncbi:MAG: hypothetical protein KY475_26570, partial [Planctomycetes bacterium]|nr:hypothetical protein [Planctomycetota bacterium]